MTVRIDLLETSFKYTDFCSNIDNIEWDFCLKRSIFVCYSRLSLHDTGYGPLFTQVVNNKPHCKCACVRRAGGGIPTTRTRAIKRRSRSKEGRKESFLPSFLPSAFHPSFPAPLSPLAPHGHSRREGEQSPRNCAAGTCSVRERERERPLPPPQPTSLVIQSLPRARSLILLFTCELIL